MKAHIISGSVSLLFVISLSLQTVGQPCENGISTNPANPVNNQFVKMGNDFFPFNGTTDTHNPFLNQFNWYWGESTITLYPNQVNWVHEFSNLNNNILMQHPYGGSMPTEFQYLRPNNVNPSFRDFRWEDGWELLYMNLGYFPDLNHINAPAAGSYYANHGQSYDPLPSNIPYFVIYNRYRGLLRIFANVWYPVDGNYSNINVTMKFTSTSADDDMLTGLLRHGSAYDVALSQTTSINALHAPRFHAPNYTQWIVADFQMGYDPCSCQSQGELEFVFTAFNTLDVEIIGRSIALEVPINDSTYTTRDFLNLSEINTGEYVPGTEIYQNMDRLAAQFEKKQLKYIENMEEYSQINPFSTALQKFGIKQVAKYLSGGLSSILISDSLLTWVTNDDWRDATSLENLPIGIEPQNVKNKFADKAKGLIGETFGFLSTEIFSPTASKPTPPAVPVATIEESVYKGTISAIDTTYSSPLVLPGSLPHAYPLGTTLEPHRLPVYNEVLGQVALLNSPDPIFFFDSNISYETLYEVEPFFQDDSCYFKERSVITSNLKLRFDNELQIAINPSLDFDLDKTNSFVRIEIEMTNDEPRQELLEATLNYSSNIIETNFRNYSEVYQYPDFAGAGTKTYIFQSEWINLEELNQYVFSFLRIDSIVNHRFGFYDVQFNPECQYQYQPNYSADQYEMELRSVKLILMHDMYFDQIGSSNEQVNTLQVHTYQLFDQGVNNLDGDPSTWSDEPLTGTFDQYIPGIISLGNETITTTHPFVHEVIGTIIIINAEEVHINGPLQVQSGFTLEVQALERILMEPGASLIPEVHMSIKQDFYNTPVFQYADNATMQSFCDNGAYQANTASKALKSRIEKKRNDQPVPEELKKKDLTTTIINLFPNPARDLVTLHSSQEMSVIAIQDLSGRTLYQTKLPTNSREAQIDLSAIAQGIYIVKVSCGNEDISKKLIITK